MKRTILKKLTACLCLCAVLSGALTVPAGAASFQDVPSNHWAATAIDRCAAQGWFQGKTADTFGVGQPMTRAGFAVALSRFFGWQSGETYYRIFSDVPQGAWYEPALRACYEHGAVTRQTGDFRPGDPITREELAVMLIRALGYGPIAGLAEDDPLPFRDVTTNKGHIAMPTSWVWSAVWGMICSCRIGTPPGNRLLSCSAACMTSCTLLRPQMRPWSFSAPARKQRTFPDIRPSYSWQER